MDFEKIYAEYFKEIYLYLRGFNLSEDQAEELAQESFVKALRAAERFDGSQNIRAWIYTIARNTFFDWKRKQKCTVNEGEYSFERADDSTIISPKSVAASVEDKELAMCVHQFLHIMEEPYKEVFYLRVFGELPFERIGIIFGKSAGWARVTFYRARIQIMEYLEGIENGKNKL